MSIIKLIKDSTIASSIVFLGATVGTVGIVSGTAMAKSTKPSTTVVVLVNSPVNVNSANVSNPTLQSASSGSVFVGGNSLFGYTSNTGTLKTGDASNTNNTTITVDQIN